MPRTKRPRVKGMHRSVYKIDTADLSETAAKELLELAIAQRSTSFHLRVIATLEFQRRYLVRTTVATQAFGRHRSAPGFLLGPVREKYAALRSHTLAHVQKDDAVLNRVVFLDNYQAFEALLAECLTAVYYIFPRFLPESNDNLSVGTVTLPDLLNNNDIKALRRAVVERKVKALMQATSLMELCSRGLKRFGVDQVLSRDELGVLVRAVACRNVVVHNDGLANGAFVALLARYKVTHRTSRGRRIVISDDDVNEARALFLALAGRTTELLGNKAAQIAAYHTSKM